MTGRKGRPPKPVEQKRAEGNLGKRKLPDVVVVGGKLSSLDYPQPPGRFDRTQGDVWHELAPILTDAGILDRVDLTLLEAFCVFVARARDAHAMVQDGGYLVYPEEVIETSRGTMTKRGAPVINPAVRLERESWKEASRLASLFGLSPADRARLGLAAKQGRKLDAELSDALGKGRGS
jgi:P27 family predicted phage terminase small subunit